MEHITIETELEAINIALDLWAFLKSTGEKKEDYLKDIHDRYLSGCSLCSFHLHQYPDDCEIIRPDKFSIRSGCFSCSLRDGKLCCFNTLGSAYNKWARTTNKEEKMKEAAIIYDALLKRKKELEATDVTPI